MIDFDDTIDPGEDERAARTDLLVAIEHAMAAAEQLSEVIGRGRGGRELALVRTKLDEANLWLGACRSVRAAGLDGVA